MPVFAENAFLCAGEVRPVSTLPLGSFPPGHACALHSALTGLVRLLNVQSQTNLTHSGGAGRPAKRRAAETAGGAEREGRAGTPGIAEEAAAGGAAEERDAAAGRREHGAAARSPRAATGGQRLTNTLRFYVCGCPPRWSSAGYACSFGTRSPPSL